MIWCDMEGDGDLDIHLLRGSDNRNHLFRNDGFAAGRHWLQVDLHGTVSNRDGIGARVHVLAEGKHQYRDIVGTLGFRAQGPFTAHFGLGDASAIDLLEIRWPSGIVQDATALAVVDSRITITEEGDTPAGDPGERLAFGLRSPYPNPFNPSTEIAFVTTSAGTVNLELFDIAGRRVRTLLSGDRPAGFWRVRWDGKDDQACALPSGVYFCRLAAGGRTDRKGLVLLK